MFSLSSEASSMRMNSQRRFSCETEYSTVSRQFDVYVSLLRAGIMMLGTGCPSLMSAFALFQIGESIPRPDEIGIEDERGVKTRSGLFMPAELRQRRGAVGHRLDEVSPDLKSIIEWSGGVLIRPVAHQERVLYFECFIERGDRLFEPRLAHQLQAPGIGPVAVA